MADQQYGRPKHGVVFHPGCYPLPKTPPKPPAESTPHRSERSEPAPAAPCARDYEGFRELLNDRRMELRMSFLELDHLAELPSGYSAKLLCGNHPKNMGADSMSKLLRALDVVVRIEPAMGCDEDSSRENEIPPHLLLLRERARRGGIARYAQLSASAVKLAAFHRKGALASAAARRAAKTKRRSTSPPSGEKFTGNR